MTMLINLQAGYFLRLHVLLNAALDSRAGCSFNVDILRNVVTPIENAEPCCQNLAVRIVILTIFLLLVLPCTLLGTFVRAGSILFNPDSAASNAQVADWLVLDKMTPVVQTDTLNKEHMDSLFLILATKRNCTGYSNL